MNMCGKYQSLFQPGYRTQSPRLKKTAAILSMAILVGFNSLLALSNPLSASDQLIQKLSSIETLSAHFQQLTEYTHSNAPIQKSSGIFWLQKPGKFRWEVTQPLHQLMVTDGQTLWFYEPELKQVIVKKLRMNLSNTPLLMFMSSTQTLKKQFTVSRVPATKPMERFRLKPKKLQEGFSEVFLSFQDNQLMEMVLIGGTETRTIIRFSNDSFEAPKPHLFSFTPPPDTDVIYDQ